MNRPSRNRSASIELLRQDVFKKIHERDFRETAGIKLPFLESITDTPTDSPDDYLHRLTISKVEFGVPSLETFQVDKTITLIGDKKVTQR